LGNDRVCIRDDTCTFVLEKTEWFTPVCEVYVDEALGFLSALEWVHQLHFGSINFELDAKKVVSSFSFARQDVTEFKMIIHNCKTIFEQYHVNSSVEFVRRQASETIHKLAKVTQYGSVGLVSVKPRLKRNKFASDKLVKIGLQATNLSK